jgi:hypothetical protein
MKNLTEVWDSSAMRASCLEVEGHGFLESGNTEEGKQTET